MVREHQVVLVSGETGCGKTTQVPQFLLDDPSIGPAASIVCTQPRRISAMSVAERIAAERGEEVGHTVGYAVRADAALGSQLSFVTPGLLLRRLATDPTLSKFTHVIIDECHEQDKCAQRHACHPFMFFFFLLLLPSLSLLLHYRPPFLCCFKERGNYS